MNAVETWVTNIRSVEKVPGPGFVLYEMVCDTDCYGRKAFGVKIRVSSAEYKMIKDKGYYLT